MNRFFRRLLEYFCFINTGAMISAAIFIFIFNRQTLFSIAIFWQILTVSLIAAFITTILMLKDDLSKKMERIKNIIHYILMNILVVVSAYIFKWIEKDFFIETIILVILISIVYIAVTVISYKNDEKMADKLNEELLHYNSKEDLDKD